MFRMKDCDLDGIPDPYCWIPETEKYRYYKSSDSCANLAWADTKKMETGCKGTYFMYYCKNLPIDFGRDHSIGPSSSACPNRKCT